MGKKLPMVALGVILLIAAALLAENESVPTVESLRKGRLHVSEDTKAPPIDQAADQAQMSPGAIFTVTNTNDAGGGSLRQAILNANAAPGFDNITFAIPAVGVQTILPLSPLPWLTDPAGVKIDGLTQGGATQGANPPQTLNLKIEIDGILCPPGVPHSVRGIVCQSDNDTIQGLIVNNFWNCGLSIQGGPTNEYARFCMIRWNIVGMDSSGTVCKGNGREQGGNLWSGICITNDPAGAGSPAYAFLNTVQENLSSCNYTEGITVLGPIQPGDVHSNFVLGNYVGTDITGTLDRGNIHEGICLAEGTHHNLVRSNLSSGNDYDGIGLQGYDNELYPPAPPIQTRHNTVDSNIVGLDINLLNQIPNTFAGITVGEYGPTQWGCADSNQIGPGNIIDNGGAGVTVWEDDVNTINADHNLITKNSIYDNGGLGIDLQNDGVTFNDPGDPDTGPNEEMNFPVITGATFSGGNTTITGTLDYPLPATTNIEVFKASADPTGYGEGKTYLGFATPDGLGNWSLAVATLIVGDSVTATATDQNNNTSEFSATVAVTSADWDCDLNPPPGKTGGGWELETNDVCQNANLAMCEAAYCGQIVPSNDIDWWVVTVPSDTCYCLHVRVFGDDTPNQYAFGGGLNPNLTIYASDCVTQLFFNDDNNGIFPDAVGQDAQYDCLDPGNCHQPATTLYIKIASSQNTEGPYLLVINCDTCECPQAQLDTCEYYKPAYVDYAPAGMPDFCQRQDSWNDPTGLVWTHCGPVALGNCFWWFDSKFETGNTPPPAIIDNYSLVQNYTGTFVDDHDPSNVIPFVDSMALYCKTNQPAGQLGTNVFDLATGALNWLNKLGLGTSYSIQVIPIDPAFGFEFIRTEVLRSQDVILLLGFWQEMATDYCERVGGHYVTVAGTCPDPVDSALCISDPFYDLNEGNPPGGPPHGDGVHNDAQYVSGPHGTMHHDRYDAVPITCFLSGAQPFNTELLNYAVNAGNIGNWAGQNEYDTTIVQVTPNGNPIHTVIEYAVVICPVEQPPPEPTPGKVKHNTDGYVPQNGSPLGTQWHELWPNYCENWTLTSWVDNGDGYLSFCDTIDFTHVPTGRKTWEHVELVTPTITVTTTDDPPVTMYLDEITPNPMCTTISCPVGTYWHEVYPNYCVVWHIVGWTDNNGNGDLDSGDDITIEQVGGPAPVTVHVETFETDIVTTPLPTPGDEYDHNIDGYFPSDNPTGTMWHELWPNYCRQYALTAWRDNGDGYLSYCDTIRFTGMIPEDTVWKHIEEVTGTIKVTFDLDTFYFDFMCGNPMVEPIFNPINTFWHEIWPVFSIRHMCVYWYDNGNEVLDSCDWINLMKIDGPDSGTVTAYHVEAWQTDIISTIIQVGPPEDTCEYYKKQYGDYAPFSVPDFDQKQNGWLGPPVGGWTHCGPVALADCFWWVDSRFEPNPLDPKPFYPDPAHVWNDGYPLVPSFSLPPPPAWDDHDTNNVQPLVNNLAFYCNTNNSPPPYPGGTWIMDLYNGAVQWIANYGLDSSSVDNWLQVDMIPAPDFEAIKSEIQKSEDVILLLGFYEDHGGLFCRLGGHYVTVAGVCTTETRICISDPWYDENEGDPPTGSAHGSSVHNDAQFISGPHGQIQHDAYLVINNPIPAPNPVVLELSDYPDVWTDITNFWETNQTEPQTPYCVWQGGPVFTMVDWILTVSPCCIGIRGDVDGSGAINVSDVTYLVYYLFRHGPPPPCFAEGDVDGNGSINVADVTYLVYYLFRHGPPPPPCP